VKIEQLGNPRDYVAAMLRRDLDVEPTPEEIDRLTASLLAAGAFAPEEPESPSLDAPPGHRAAAPGISPS
jgi:hypothetical protein